MHKSKVKFCGDKPYIEYKHKNGYTNRVFGSMVTCYNCGETCFVTPRQLSRNIIQFCSMRCRAKAQPPRHWKGGRITGSYGYIWVRKNKHYIAEHRLLTSAPKGMVVHHMNGVKDDNRLDNLCVMTRGAHRRIHA